MQSADFLTALVAKAMPICSTLCFVGYQQLCKKFWCLRSPRLLCHLPRIQCTISFLPTDKKVFDC